MAAGPPRLRAARHLDRRLDRARRRASRVVERLDPVAEDVGVGDERSHIVLAGRKHRDRARVAWAQAAERRAVRHPRPLRPARLLLPGGERRDLRRRAAARRPGPSSRGRGDDPRPDRGRLHRAPLPPRGRLTGPLPPPPRPLRRPERMIDVWRHRAPIDACVQRMTVVRLPNQLGEGASWKSNPERDCIG